MKRGMTLNALKTKIQRKMGLNRGCLDDNDRGRDDNFSAAE